MKIDFFNGHAVLQPLVIGWPRYVNPSGYFSKKLPQKKESRVETPYIKYGIPIKQKPYPDASLFRSLKNGRNLPRSKRTEFSKSVMNTQSCFADANKLNS